MREDPCWGVFTRTFMRVGYAMDYGGIHQGRYRFPFSIRVCRIAFLNNHLQYLNASDLAEMERSFQTSFKTPTNAFILESV